MGQLQEKTFHSFHNKILARLGKSKDLQSLTKAKASDYLSKVDSRAKGKLGSPVLETLLSFNYQHSPHQEILNGFSKLYSTQNHPKAQGVNWQIKVPASWSESEGRGPSSIQKITSDYGDGNPAIVLMIKDASPPGSPEMTEKEINALLNEKGMRTTISGGGSGQSTLSNYARHLPKLALHFGCLPTQLDADQINDYPYQLRQQHDTPSQTCFMITSGSCCISPSPAGAKPAYRLESFVLLPWPSCFKFKMSVVANSG